MSRILDQNVYVSSVFAQVCCISAKMKKVMIAFVIATNNFDSGFNILSYQQGNNMSVIQP